MDDSWPSLPIDAWADTAATLHRWTQIVGKVRLTLTPWLNHSWHVPLYVTVRGLGTSPIPAGKRTIELDFDFLEHALVLRDDTGRAERLPLQPMSVADFYRRVSEALTGLDIHLHINTVANEIPDSLPLNRDEEHGSYDADSVQRFWRTLLSTDRVMKEFRSGFLGKASPVHFFWGSFDLAVTRFSGRGAPLHPGGIPNLPDAITREAYSHEVSSAGFWPGAAGQGDAFFYSYAYPTPDGMKDAAVEPSSARYDDQLGEFVLPYEQFRQSEDPDATLLAFFESTYRAAAETGGWHAEDLECPRGRPGIPRPLS